MQEIIWKISACGPLSWPVYVSFWCSLFYWLLAGSPHPVWYFHSRWDTLQLSEQVCRRALNYLTNYIHTYLHTYVCTYIHSFVHSFVPSFIHSFFCLFVYLFIHSFIHSFICMYVCICMYTYMHACMHAHILSWARPIQTTLPYPFWWYISMFHLYLYLTSCLFALEFMTNILLFMNSV
jgi:hypothetical protein